MLADMLYDLGDAIVSPADVRRDYGLFESQREEVHMRPDSHRRTAGVGQSGLDDETERGAGDPGVAPFGHTERGRATPESNGALEDREVSTPALGEAAYELELAREQIARLNATIRRDRAVQKHLRAQVTFWRRRAEANAEPRGCVMRGKARAEGDAAKGEV